MSSGDEQQPPTTEDPTLSSPIGDSRDALPADLSNDQSTDEPVEQVESYMRLHEHIERLHADRAPQQADAPDATEAAIYQMAAFFRAAAPGASDPDPAFAARLLSLLEDTANAPVVRPTMPMAPAAINAMSAPHGEVSAINGSPITPSDDTVSPMAGDAATTTTTPPTPLAPRQSRRQSGVSRRGLLTGGLSAAAAAVVGVAAGAAIERAAGLATPPGAASVALVPEGAGVWVAIAPVAAIPLGQVKHFQTAYIVGFIRHTAQGFSALSGVCTHMSCLLAWNTSDRTFDCPCHGGRFAENGQAAATSRIAYSPLPTIETKVDQGQVWVYVIPASAQPTTPTHGRTYGSPTSRK